MATDSRGGTSTAGHALINDMATLAFDQHVSDSDDSGSSYIGSGLPSPPSASICEWRTDRFHDQECERFFDCPTHIVERSLSVEGDDVRHDVRHDDLDGGDDLYDDTSENEEGEARHSRSDEDASVGRFEVPSGSPRPSEPSTRDASGPPREGGSIEGASSRTSSPVSTPDGDVGISNEENNLTEEGGEDYEDESENATYLAAPARQLRTGPEGAAMDQPPPRRSSLPGTQMPTRGHVDASTHSLPPVPQDQGYSPAPSSSRQQPQTPPLPPLPQSAAQRTSLYAAGRYQGTSTLTRLEDIISSMSEPRAAPRVPQQPPHGAARRANQEQPAPPREIILPRWQPDNEATFCPICRTQFSIFVRKHHCRKCGRVVCNSCSPHRIVIPHQFIVQPPGQPRRYPSYMSGGDFGLEGGERVRLCNPCVPDPNTTPPQAQSRAPGSPFSPRSPQGHNRSQSSSNHPGAYQTGAGSMSPLGRISPMFSNRNRSVTMAGSQSQYPPAAGLAAYGTQYHHRSRENQILSGTPPTPRSDYLQSSEADNLRHHPGSSAHAGPSNIGPSRYYQIPEEDECPVCHRELPSRNLPDADALRESHITMCIQSHSQYGSGPSSGGGGGGDGSPATPPGMGMRRATGMFPYKATEKDCVDSAECTICLEEFEVGVPMARLECLCRFHKSCIMAWWKNHPGRCPVHQHDAFGF
ncbi:hypothetical protein MKZ38_008621 [Zalerion maritima]|uniref:RING-type E3 ubiquitin transferase n=1 Tax=Zalerion maritima TaxID=339359 RepID=A0AAD5WVE8_9PEZI|nr:hypothetical protein MKZ38_008621 [Zalerion maritima]